MTGRGRKSVSAASATSATSSTSSHQQVEGEAGTKRIPVLRRSARRAVPPTEKAGKSVGTRKRSNTSASSSRSGSLASSVVDDNEEDEQEMEPEVEENKLAKVKKSKMLVNFKRREQIEVLFAGTELCWSRLAPNQGMQAALKIAADPQSYEPISATKKNVGSQAGFNPYI